MKRLTGFIIAIALIASIVTPTIAHAAKDDITGHWAEHDLRSLIENKILSGYGAGEYRPQANVTRAEFTSFLVRALNLKRTDHVTSFKDVKENVWYSSGIEIATSHKLIGGYPDGTFKPNNNISREEMAAMVVRALKSQDIAALDSTYEYADEKEIRAMFLPAVKQLTFLEIIGGKRIKDEMHFAPRSYATRGETAAILSRMLNVIENPKVVTSYTQYPYDFDHMLTKQVNGTPKLDGAGKYTASKKEVHYYVNPSNFKPGSSQYMQFLQLSHSTGLSPELLNNHFLKGMGNLEGLGAAFVEAGKALSINEIYLIAHTLHETGNGKSQLARGIEVGIDKNHRAVMVTDSNRKSLRDIKVAYNMYGVAAYDNSALQSGSQYAYSRGWFTPTEAIIGGAEFIDRYIERGQDTLYKMKWNPASPGYPQYATHVQWATIQALKIHNMYSILDRYVIKFDIPKFTNTVRPSLKPEGVERYHIHERLVGELGQTISGVNFRQGPTTSFTSHGVLPKETPLTILGNNGGWYKALVDGVEGWISGDYVLLDKDKQENTVALFSLTSDESPLSNAEFEVGLKTIEAEVGGLELRSTPEYDNNLVHILSIGTEITILEILDDWVRVRVNEDVGFINAQHLGM